MVEGVLAARGDDPYRAYRTVQELSEAVQAPDWEEVLIAYARCKRIVRDVKERYPLQPERLTEPSAQRLYRAYLEARERVSPDGSARELVAALRDLKDPINAFFTDILVMAEDPELRAARLGLVQHVAALPDGIVDLSRLQGF